ncbi:nudix hydrolase 11-like [Acanthaster planci]|uniref:Nudix hydrolase 11-like n=1 Tax=Acanthaster planci TaxID=133434 RepID=A0A8B7XKJ2_ACAPL|nr:nudix hydrolase 11-like [Acanthaster planci]
MVKVQVGCTSYMIMTMCMYALANCLHTNDLNIGRLRPLLCRIYLFKGLFHPFRCFREMAEIPSTSSSTFMEPSKDEVVARLRQMDATEMLAGLPPLPTSLPKAAVLIPLFYRNRQLHVLLTVRSTNLKSHRGEVAFPGGKSDEGDADLKTTALRETEEEIGLARERVQVVAQLGPTFALKGTLVIPVVGFIPDDFTPVPNPDEVSDVFTVPFSTFLRTEDHMQREWKDDSGYEYTLNFFNHLEGGKQFITFGLTASICITAATICFARSPDFKSVVQYDPSNPRKILELSKNSYMRRLRKLKKVGQGKL